jgi:hypothetical protein
MTGHIGKTSLAFVTRIVKPTAAGEIIWRRRG